MVTKETAAASRSPEGLSFPHKPEYTSPFFSFEINNLDTLKAALVKVYGKYEFATVHIGEGVGVVGPPRIHLDSIRDFELLISLGLPEEYFIGSFINTEGNLLPLGGYWRGRLLEKKLRKYVDSDLHLEGYAVEKERGSTVLRRVATIPHYRHGGFAFKFPKETLVQAENTLLKYYLTEAMTILVIYCTELYKHYGMRDMKRKIVLGTPISVTDCRERTRSARERLADLESGGIENAVAKAILGLSDDRESPEVRIASLSKLVEHYQAELRVFKAHLGRSEARVKTLEEEARDRQTTPYDILGISETATQGEILGAYRQQVSVWHPDFIGGLLDKAGLSPTDPRRDKILQFASERMVKINQAFKELKRQGRV